MSAGPAQAILSARSAERLRRGALHVARTEIVRGPTDSSDVVELRDERGRTLGSGLWAAEGSLAVRLWDREGRGLDPELLAARIAAAAARRRQLFSGTARDAYRVVHGEADLLPGLFVDRYGDAAVIQTVTAAMDRRKPQLAALLAQVLGVSLVVCRDDGSGRDLESLPRTRGVLLGPERESAPVRFHDAGSLMEADLLHDRKTGSFLDQQENHAAVADYAGRFFGGAPEAKALDCFTYHGGFALALARAGLSVVACDEDPDAIARARKNAALGGGKVDFRVANAFDLLRLLESSGARFSAVVIDPPALAKRGRAAGGGGRPDDSAWERAYKELNLRAMRLLAPGGLLCTCSCSGRVSDGDFGAIVEAASRDVGRPMQLIEKRGAGRDHPVLVGMPESGYLKCWLLRAVD